MSKIIQCGTFYKHALRALAKRRNGKIIQWEAFCKECKTKTVVLTKHSEQYKAIQENLTDG